MALRSIRLPDGIIELVKATGLPQTVTGIEFDGETPIGTGQHVAFLDDGAVRSVPLADWPQVQAELAAKETERQAAQALKQQILQTAQSAVGVRLSDLTAVQRNALIAVLLWKADRKSVV